MRLLDRSIYRVTSARAKILQLALPETSVIWFEMLN